MPYSDLRSFLRVLESRKLLKRIPIEVDPELEITEIATRVVREEGPALLFEKVKGSPFRLLINLFGSPERVSLALGKPPAELGADLARLALAINPPSLVGLWKCRKTIRRLLSMRLRRTRNAPAQAVEEEPALDRWPALKCWPQDAGRFITFPLVITQHPVTCARNMGLYRLQVHSSSIVGLHWQIQKGGGFHYAEAEKHAQSLPVAAVVGADPALLIASVAPLPEGMDEIAFSGFLRGQPTKMIKARSIPVEVPAESEFVLEGVAAPQERLLEGPFGDHFGHYSHAAPFPVMHVRRVTRRKDPIYLAAVVGKPPQEDRYLGNALQEILSPLIRMMRPEVQDLWAYYEAGFHNLLVASVHQRYGKEGMKTALGLLGEGQLSLTKCLVLVDAQVNVRDFHEVLQAIRQNFDARKDMLILPGVPLDTLDFTSFTMNLGSKMILDATRKGRPVTGHRMPPNHGILRDLKDKDPRISGWRLWDEALLVVQARKEGRKVLEHLVRDSDLEGVKIIAAVSPDVDVDDRVSTLWGIFTRFDCARDVVFTETTLVGPVARHSGRLGIDATFKRGYPETLDMSEEIRDKVTARWPDYRI